MTIDTSKLRVSTKSLVGLVVTAGTLFQIPAVHDFIIALAHNHPHVLGFFGTVTGVIGLLHNPAVQDVLGIKRSVEVKTEEVTIAPAVKQ
jgi:hypothetical protein